LKATIRASRRGRIWYGVASKQLEKSAVLEEKYEARSSLAKAADDGRG